MNVLPVNKRVNLNYNNPTFYNNSEVIMKKSFIRAFVNTAITAVAFSVSCAVYAGSLVLTSSDIGDGKHMAKTQEYTGFGCAGGNLSPSLAGVVRQRAQKHLHYWCTTPMRLQAVGGGTGRWLTFPPVPRRYPLARGR